MKISRNKVKCIDKHKELLHKISTDDYLKDYQFEHIYNILNVLDKIYFVR